MLEAAPHRGVPGPAEQIGGASLGVSRAGRRGRASVEGHDGLAAAFVGVLDNAGSLAG